MAKKKTRSLKKWKKRLAEKRAIRMQPVPSVAPEDIDYASRIYDLAHQPDSSLKTPDPRSVTLDMGNGKTQGITLTDNPLNRFLDALSEYCGDDEEKYMNIARRLFALQEVTPEKFDPYIRYSPDGEPLFIHTAIFHAAAVVSLKKGEEVFDEDEFFAKLRELVAESETGQPGTSSSEN